MLARTYVGYGASSLGIDAGSSNPQPAQHFGQSGSPGSILSQALPLPGAMQNHFVIANWYTPEENSSVTAEQQSSGIASTNTLVKILKYYSGATLEGDVVLGELGVVPNAKLLIERDAFSGEDPSDTDARTYWIPIGSAQADDDGHFSLTVPSGRIRVTAFMGDSDLVSARDSLATADQNIASSWAVDLVTAVNDDRTVNPITGILANVSGSTWLGEATINVTGDQGHSNGASMLNLDISVAASGATGTIEW